MSVFYAALVVGGAVAVAYLWLVLDAFRRTRRELEDPALVLDEQETAETYERQGRGFSWVAGLGVAASSALLVLVSLTASIWYLLPFLSIGTALAVVVAFLHDRGDLAPDDSALHREGAVRG